MIVINIDHTTMHNVIYLYGYLTIVINIFCMDIYSSDSADIMK